MASPKNFRLALSIRLKNPRTSRNWWTYAWNWITGFVPMWRAWNATPLQPHPELDRPQTAHLLTQQAPIAETMGLPPWTSQRPRRHKTNADVMSTWQRDSASTVGLPTILRANVLPWPPITPGRSASPPPKFQPHQPNLLPPPSPAREKSSPSTAHWLCWWTCPHLFLYIISGNSLCISKLFVK
jgi:hypothetical protein